MLALLSAVQNGSPAAAASGALAECEKKPSYRKHKEAGLDYFLFGAYFLALSELMTAQAPCPEDYHLLAKIGRIYHLLGQSESASAVYRDYLKRARVGDPDYLDVMRWIQQLMNAGSQLPSGSESSTLPSTGGPPAVALEGRPTSRGREQKAAAGLFIAIGGLGLATSIGLLAIHGKDELMGRTCSTGFSGNEPCFPLDSSSYAWPMFGVSMAVFASGSIWLAQQPWHRKRRP